MTSNTTLLSIIAYARSGALDHAWRLFREAGFDSVTDDPAVLSVRGRLLKDSALGASGAERRRLYLEAAQAYARAGEPGGASYPLINAATLSLLAGRTDQAKALAAQVLERSGAQPDEPETPYYRAATRAEALLLLGDVAKAKLAFAEAIALAPRAWEDHASTLRQFGLILGELGQGAAWLDPLRPPRSLHFAGHMAVAPREAGVGRKIREVLEKERIGFGYGALAAGADILIAEALLERRAELHLVLPAPPETFRRTSVETFGGDWGFRFDAVIARADSVHTVAGTADPAGALGIQLAAQVAMGEAVMQAQTLMTEAVQLLILDTGKPESRKGGASVWLGAAWKDSGRRQHVIVARRTTGRPAAVRSARGLAPARLAALLAVQVSEPQTADGAHIDRLVGEVFPRVGRALAKGPAAILIPRWTGDALAAAYASPIDAAEAALSIADALGGVASVRIGGHFGVVRRVDDPFGGAPLLLGADSAIHVSEDFAAALHAGGEVRARTEYVGDLPISDPEDPVRLFSVKP